MYSNLFEKNIKVKISSKVDGIGSHFLEAQDNLLAIENLIIVEGKLPEVKVEASKLDVDSFTDYVYRLVNRIYIIREQKARLLKTYKKRFDIVKPSFADFAKVRYLVKEKGKGLLVEKRVGPGEKDVLDRVYCNLSDGVIFRNRVKIGVLV